MCKGEEDYRNYLIAAIQLFAPRQNQLCSYHYQLQHPWVYCILLLCCRLCSHIFSDAQSRTLLMQFKTTTSDIITFKEQCISSFTLSQSPLSQFSLVSFSALSVFCHRSLFSLWSFPLLVFGLLLINEHLSQVNVLQEW